MFGIVTMGDYYAVRRFLCLPSSSLQNVEKTVRTKSWVDSRSGHLPCDGNASTGVFLDVYRDPWIFYQVGLLKTVLNLLSSVAARLARHRNRAYQGQQNIAIVF